MTGHPSFVVGFSHRTPTGIRLLDRERDATGALRAGRVLASHLRREAYAADITYGTNHEFGFDYLRDNLVYQKRFKFSGW